VSAAGDYYRKRGEYCIQLAEKVPAQKMAHLAAASAFLKLATKFDRQEQTESPKLANSRQANLLVIQAARAAEQRTNMRAERRVACFAAMRSSASIILGVSAIALVTLVCVLYDHPTLETPQVLTSLHHHVSSQPL
jgi:hypothetical protein